jgi:hypothetical protein
MTRYQRLRPSVRFSPPRTREAVALLVGDLCLVAVLITLGLLRHNISDPWQYPGYLGSRIAPFVLGWLLVAPFFGLFEGERLLSYRTSLLPVIPAWITAAVLGATLRVVGTSGGAGPVFIAVMVVFGLLVLVPWRLAVVVLSRRLAR